MPFTQYKRGHLQRCLSLTRLHVVIPCIETHTKIKRFPLIATMGLHQACRVLNLNISDLPTQAIYFSSLHAHAACTLLLIAYIIALYYVDTHHASEAVTLPCVSIYVYRSCML